MKKNVLLFLLSTVASLLAAQGFDEVVPCVTHLIPPAYSSGTSDGNIVQTIPDNTEKIIPVVFHIFHESGLENISRENVLLALERLNKDFDRNHENLPQTPEVFKNIAADVDVRFVLATKDPQGNCTDGINRYYTPLTSLVLGNSFALPEPLEPYQWDYKRYLNVFVSKSLTGYQGNDIYVVSLGYGTFPGSFVNLGMNAIFLSHETLLFSQNGISSGETISHEVGHWLDLRHIWGDTGPDVLSCSDSDGISDTPNQEGPSGKCFSNFPFVTCNNGPNGNIFCNFMDYGDKGCRTMFTNGQNTRMQNILNTRPDRKDLSTDANLEFTGVNQWNSNFSCPTIPNADFATDQAYFIYCKPNIEVKFQERCFNGSSDSLRWFFPGGTPSMANSPEVVVNYPDAGLYQVTLVASNEFGSDTITRSVKIQAIDGIPYVSGGNGEDFETANSIDDVGAVFQVTGGVNFKISNAAGFNSSKSLECKRGVGEYYRLRFITKKFEIGPQDSVFSFYLSHRGEEFPRNKGIRVVASYNCRDVNTEQSIGLLLGDEIETTTIGSSADVYIPNNPDQWKEINFIIPPQFRGRNDVQFQFNYTADQTNNLYIDNIRVKSSIMTLVSEPGNNFDWNIYPNPTNAEFIVEFYQHGSPAIFKVFDINGRLMHSQEINANKKQINVGSTLPPGFYVCQLVDSKGCQFGSTKKLIKY